MRSFFSLFLLFFAVVCWGQSTQLTEFNQGRLQRQRTAMLVLGGWAVGNIGYGLAARGNATGVNRHFHDMNIGWNAVNLTIAALGYYTASKTDPASFDLYTSLQEEYKIQKILLLNAGLDVGYMMGGLYLMERSKNSEKNADRLKGFGQSILLQGGFLFAFDLATYFVLQNHAGEIPELLSGLQFSGNSIGLHLTF